MKKVIILLATASILMANSCKIDKSSALLVKFKAFKTPLKLGVGGKFDEVEYIGKREAKTISDLLVGATVDIKTYSVNSNNKARDAKLVGSFFKAMSYKDIKAEIKSIDAKEDVGIISIEIVMNGIKKIIPLKYTIKENILKAEGVIDLFDFGAQKALRSINKACFKLHKGKTWSDVEIGFEMKIVCST